MIQRSNTPLNRSTPAQPCCEADSLVNKASRSHELIVKKSRDRFYAWFNRLESTSSESCQCLRWGCGAISLTCLRSPTVFSFSNFSTLTIPANCFSVNRDCSNQHCRPKVSNGHNPKNVGYAAKIGRMSFHWATLIAIYFTALLSATCVTAAITQDSVAAIPDKQVSDWLVPTGRLLTPAGDSLLVPQRPNDLCYYSPLDLVFVKGHKQLLIVSATDWKLQQTLNCPGGASLTGIIVDKNGAVYVSNASNGVHVFTADQTANLKQDQKPTYRLDHSLDLANDSFPCGLCLSQDQQTLYVCLSKSNSVAVVDLKSKAVTGTIPVGIAPYDIQLVPGTYNSGSVDRLFVSNVGGRQAIDGEETAPSAGTQTPIDDRGIANTSLISVIDINSGQVTSGIKAGLHATQLLLLPSPQPAGKNGTTATILVTNSNDDSITLIDSRSLETKTQITKPISDLPFGSMPDSACLSNDGHWLFVGLAGNNAIAVYDISNGVNWKDGLPEPAGFIPTAWYPAGLECSESDLLVANLKGIGSRHPSRPLEKGLNSHDHKGQLQKVALSDVANQKQLHKWTSAVLSQAKMLPVARVEERQQQGDLSLNAKPVPDKLGQPSTFQHVIYVIKENRTYDQVFGDMPEGRGEAALCTIPEKYTPNHHALARRFGLLDNYYCNGVLSADGHSWATEANVTPYLERAFGGFSRSYTFGDDPITYSSSGFLWDHVLSAGLSFRNYGEMNYSEPPAGMKYQEIWDAYQKGEPIQFQNKIGIDRLRRYSCPDYPGWNMVIPDVLRMDRFLAEFETFKQEGGLANLSIVYLPQDHLGGGVTSAAHMADNDLAIGRLVDAVSHSNYWKNTLILINEDDPQNGYDHIDGHRSICLAVSAYSKSGVNHHFYNQTSAIRTMLHVLGLPPMNQQDGRSRLMTECFGNTADLSPYDAIAANFPLNQRPGEDNKQSAVERKWRNILSTVPIQRTGMKTEQDEDNLNRFIWHEMKGWQTPYPEQWAGAHGRGLKELGLQIDLDATQDR